MSDVKCPLDPKAKHCMCLSGDWPPEMNGCEPIHQSFYLSYSAYFVAPRSVLQSMPKDWQARFVSLVNELNSRFDGLPDSLEYRVVTVDVSLLELPEDHPLTELIEFPAVPDPYRDYERGRRRVELREGKP